MSEYNGFTLFDRLPDGWVFDLTAGSPLHGYVFATDGKSVLRGGKRVLVRHALANPQIFQYQAVYSKTEAPAVCEKMATELDRPAYSRVLNRLAREKLKQKILEDILVDLNICKTEGWSKTEYIKELVDMISGVAKQRNHIAK